MRCDRCDNEFHETLERCPHCGRPGLYANVIAASKAEDVAAVDQRHEAAGRDADRRGCRDAFDALTAWLEGTVAVVARGYPEVHRLAATDRSVYGTYYDLVQSGLLLPDGGSWDLLREPADALLFPNYREKIRFAALSVDGWGVARYGDFFLTLRTPLIEHRASVYDGNSTVLVRFLQIDDATRVAEKLRGRRAPWATRAKLAAAQLGSHLDAASREADFQGLLLADGPIADGASDRFIEVNIWGPMTVRTVERVAYSKSGTTRRGIYKVELKRLERLLQPYGVALEGRP
ncbi:MAG: hypothetical protein IT370_07645 [Deltaproteobacteria bacterium]|nr:hypothetical protein [Deltaproteobacteria bacterium]